MEMGEMITEFAEQGMGIERTVLNRMANWTIVTFKHNLEDECFKIKLPLEASRKNGIPAPAIYKAIESLKLDLERLITESIIATYSATGETVEKEVKVSVDIAHDSGEKLELRLNVKSGDG